MQEQEAELPPDMDEETPPTYEVRSEIARHITFATHQCDIPIIADLVVANPFDEDLEDVSLRLSAEPPVIADRIWTIDRIAGGSEFTPRDRSVSIAGGTLGALTERMRAEVTLQLLKDGEVLAETRHPIIALARNEWGGSRHMPELLAAFVMPNDLAVQRVLKDASRILAQAGKNGSLEGYQSKSRQRCWEILSGIWAAVCQRGLTYAEPPASFGREGQKIRFPSMIEDQGLATCLDTALLFAAVIEQAGLNPVVVFTEGHALAGAWLQPQHLPSLIVEDPMEIRKAIAQDEMVLFETTMATGGRATPFSRALAEGVRQVAEPNEDAFVYAIDIRQARGRGVEPLSSEARPTMAPGEPGESDADAPPLEEAPELPPFDTETIVEETPQSPAERLERWKRSLLDLSKRNRLLNLKPSSTAIPIFCPDPGLLEDKIADGKRISIITPPERRGVEGEPDAELFHLRTGEDYAVSFARDALARNEIVANVDAKSLTKGAIDLYRKAKADFEEGGSNTLFLAIGMLRWAPVGDAKRSFRAPLIMLPVKLERKSAASKPYLTKHEDDPVFNLTLLQMLRQDFHIEIPGLDAELPTDEHGVDVRRIWETVRARIREVAGFEVVEEVVLSTFSFAKYLMWKDLADRTETLKTSPFVRHMIDTPREPYEGGASFLPARAIDREIDPSEIMAPLNADSSQIVAIHASGSEGDFVLEGPPGTGKSETISNIIAHNLGLGRRVLFASEKMAALDVVYRRLNACGLGDFCLELHSARANKRAVLEQLGAAWENREAHSADEWRRKAERLGEIRAELNGLVEALHRPGPGGLSPRDAIGRSARYADVHRFRLDWGRDASGRGRAETPGQRARLEEMARRLDQQFAALQPSDLDDFAGLAHTDWSYAWVEQIVGAAQKLGSSISELQRRRRDFLEKLGVADAGAAADESAAVAAIANTIAECAAQNLRFALEADSRERIEALDGAASRLDGYQETRKRLSADYPDDKIVAAPAAVWMAERDRAMKKIWPFSALALRRLRRSMRDALGVDATVAPTPERDLQPLLTLIDIRREIDAVDRDLLRETPWRGFGSDEAKVHQAARSGRRLREAVIQLCGHGRDLVETRAALARSLCDGRDLLEPGAPIAVAADMLARAYEDFSARRAEFLSLSARAEDDERAGDLEALAIAARAVVEQNARLNVWCQWIVAARDGRALGLGALVAALEGGEIVEGEAVEALRTAYACWLAPILIDARPELKRFSSVRHEDLIETFRALDREVAELAVSHIRAKLSGDVPARDGIGKKDPGYGVLARELQKKMRHMPVRKLVGEMGDALMTLTPCLMMSPLSVAQFLPADSRAFDLVVFDEASQITVPDAIGAIARGERCIVVGDPKQMPPTNFFARGAEDDANEDVRDLESILDEALAARVPHHRLTGHYRSRHESLICFSNHAYYGGQLVTYPSADTSDTAIRFHRVAGVYAKGSTRTNSIEAQALVAEAVRRLRDPELGRLSLGVVTLNSEQQRLIEDLLDHERRKDPSLEPHFQSSSEEPVFVKNLETVQGDQRDVILLSIGYGPTEPGAKTMSMNFGPLNRQGGERRLNVAITRATTEIAVFASFDASMIDLTRTSSEAVKDLKHFIDFAARGPVALGEAVTLSGAGNSYDSDFEMAVAERLRNLGWIVRTQVGVSKFRIDLGVVHPDHPGRFLAGIECDGATYHSSPSARDRDRVRQVILEQLGWRLFRLWSTDFFLDADAAIDALDQRLRERLEDDRSEQEEASRSSAAEHEERTSTSVDDNAAPDASSYATSSDAENLGSPGELFETTEDEEAIASRKPSPTGATKPAVQEHEPDPSRFHDADYRDRLGVMALGIIDGEGPITFKRLSDRLARTHGFQRTGRQISSSVWAACEKLRRHVATSDGHKVFWPDGVEPVTEFPFRGLEINGERRDWRETPLPEKLWLVRQVGAQSELDEATRAVAEKINLGRVTSRFRDEIEELRRLLLQTPAEDG